MSKHKGKKTPGARLAVEFAIGVALLIVLAMPHKLHPWINLFVVVVWVWMCAAASYRFWRNSRLPTDPQSELPIRTDSGPTPRLHIVPFNSYSCP